MYTDFALHLNIDPNDAEQIKNSKNQSLKDCSYKLLRIHWEGTREPSYVKWRVIRDAINEIEKPIIIEDLGIDKFCEEFPTESPFPTAVQQNEPMKHSRHPQQVAPSPTHGFNPKAAHPPSGVITAEGATQFTSQPPAIRGKGACVNLHPCSSGEAL